MPGGLIYTYGLFLGDQQIGFQCFAEYVPWGDKTKKRIFHFNRTVIHPDYVGFGLGMKLIDETSALIKRQYDYKIMGKFSSLPVYKSMIKNPSWALVSTGYNTNNGGSKAIFHKTRRRQVKWWSFEYRPVSQK